MTIATRAPVIMPSMATPKRISNQLTTRPPGEVTNAESPAPRTVAIPQLNESKNDSALNGFSRTVIRIAAIATTTTMPSVSEMKNRRSSCPATRRRCQATRRMIGLDRIGSEIDGFGIDPIVPQAGPRMHVFAQVLGRFGPRSAAGRLRRLRDRHVGDVGAQRRDQVRRREVEVDAVSAATDGDPLQP